MMRGILGCWNTFWNDWQGVEVLDYRQVVVPSVISFISQNNFDISRNIRSGLMKKRENLLPIITIAWRGDQGNRYFCSHVYNKVEFITEKPDFRTAFSCMGHRIASSGERISLCPKNTGIQSNNLIGDMQVITELLRDVSNYFAQMSLVQASKELSIITRMRNRSTDKTTCLSIRRVCPEKSFQVTIGYT